MAHQPKRTKEVLAERQRQMEDVILTHQAGLLRYAATLLENHDLARQVVQDVFIKLFQKWDEVETGGATLRAWLFCVTHNQAVDLIRSEERRRARQLAYIEINHSSEDRGFRAFEREERLALVLKVVRALSPSRQQVLLLRLQQGMDYKEISAVTGYTVPTCRNLLSEAVAQVTELIRKLEGEYA